ISYFLLSDLVAMAQSAAGAAPASSFSAADFMAFSIAIGQVMGGLTGMTHSLAQIIIVVPPIERARPIIETPIELPQDCEPPGVLLQHGRLSSGSIFENIVGDARLGMDEAWAAARMVGLDRDVEAMPMGMHTVLLDGGATLSGGQRQRILIARALVRQPRV